MAMLPLAMEGGYTLAAGKLSSGKALFLRALSAQMKIAP